MVASSIWAIGFVARSRLTMVPSGNWADQAVSKASASERECDPLKLELASMRRSDGTVTSEIERRGTSKAPLRTPTREASAYRGDRQPVAGHDRRADHARMNIERKSVPIEAGAACNLRLNVFHDRNGY